MAETNIGALVVLTSEFIDSLPEDPEEAFPIYEAEARRISQNFDYNGNEDINRKKYIDLIYAFIELYGIGPNLQNPITMTYQEFVNYYPIAESQITIFSAKMALKSGISKRTSSAYVLTPAIREEVSHYISQIREVLNQLNLSDGKREALFKRLNDFQSEVDKDRTRIEQWASAYFFIKKEIKNGVEELKPVLSKMEKISDAISKADEWIKRLPSPEQRKQIEGPKTVDEFEDEIPF